MKTNKVLVLGASGMIGRSVFQELHKAGFDVFGTTRNIDLAEDWLKPSAIEFDALHTDRNSLSQLFSSFEYVVNTLGLIKQSIDEKSTESRMQAISLNANFPCLISGAVQHDQKVIQIATDCVFSGDAGNYSEDSSHDASDVYGKTKSLGEIISSNFLNIRCSVIGPEKTLGKGLLNWVTSQPENQQINGYKNHIWNGVTSETFAKVVVGIIHSKTSLSGTYHLVPEGKLSKAELVREIANKYGRNDLEIKPITAPNSVDRTLATNFQEVNQELWRNAGYFRIPTIVEQISAMKVN